MARVTISLPEDLASDAAKRAAADKRSVSSYVALLIEEDVRQHAAPPPAFREFVAKAEAATSENPELLGELESTLRRALRAAPASV